jgi:N-sulfoglucosamine sulfohydrolase
MKLLNRFLLLIIPIVISCKSTVVESSNHKQTQTKALTVSVKLEIEKPNFIFYLADDQDQLDYGCYGNPKVSTPNVDLLAKEGMLFNNFYTAQAICAPSRSQVYTGMYPVKSGGMANHIGVKPDIKSVTNYLIEAGYEVVLAGKSHVKPNSVFDWTTTFESIDHRWLPLDEIDFYLKNVKTPFCLFITSNLPHGPYPEETKYKEEDIFRLPYQNGVQAAKAKYYQSIDDDNIQLGKILKMVDKYGFRDNSLFIYSADHGASGKYTLKEQGLKTPFVARWPGVIKPNTTSKTVLTYVDILPTFLEVVNVKIPENIDGKSFLNTLKGSEEKVHDYIYGVQTKQNVRGPKIFPSRMVRGERFKFIRNYNSLEVLDSNLGDNPIVNEFITLGAKSYPKTPYEELYDLSIDPYQAKNLAKDPRYKSQKEELSQELDTWMIEQNDFLLTNKMPLIKSTKHPLDKQTKHTNVAKHLRGTLKPQDYIKLHY